MTTKDNSTKKNKRKMDIKSVYKKSKNVEIMTSIIGSEILHDYMKTVITTEMIDKVANMITNEVIHNIYCFYLIINNDINILAEMNNNIDTLRLNYNNMIDSAQDNEKNVLNEDIIKLENDINNKNNTIINNCENLVGFIYDIFINGGVDLLWDNPLINNVKLDYFKLAKPDKIQLDKSIYKCKKCGSDKIITYVMQTKSNDEGITTVIHCNNCQHVSKL
jgi:DNA-directed RNA polymerase subunit M/transcription elongation factor TFIIS